MPRATLRARDVPLSASIAAGLGFLTDISPEHMLEAIDAILAGDYLDERRLMLSAQIGDGSSHAEARSR